MPAPLSVTLKSDREVEIVRTFEAPRDLVFECHINAELVRRWLLGPPGWTMPVCEIDARVGGRYRYVWRSPDGTDMGMGGVFREMLRPERLVTNEAFDEDWTGGETTVTTVFTERGGVTTSTLTVLYASKEAREGALATGMTDGMEMSYRNLDRLLAEETAG